MSFGIWGSVIDAVHDARMYEKKEDFAAKQASTQYQRAAIDLEKAGLNRVLALGSPAAAAPAPSSNPTTFGAAGAAKDSNTLANKQFELSKDTVSAQVLAARSAAARDLSQSDLYNEQRELVKIQQVSATAQAYMDEVTKAGYEAVLPAIRSVVDWIQKNITGSSDARSSTVDSVKRGLESSKSGAREIERMDKVMKAGHDEGKEVMPSQRVQLDADGYGEIRRRYDN